jgi:hypothetical protein
LVKTGDSLTKLKGLFTLAAGPVKSMASVTSSQLQITSIYASNDGLWTLNKQTEAQSLWPSQTQYVRIEGGNHAQFGDYGPQATDNEAVNMTLQEQRSAVVSAVVNLTQRL